MKRLLLAATLAVSLLPAPAQALTIDKPGCIYRKVGLQQIIFVECQGKLHDILDAATRKPLKKVLLQGERSAKLCWVLPRTKRLLCA